MSDILNQIPNKTGIYKISCLSNNTFYIGSSKNIQKRITSHFKDLVNNKHLNQKFQNIFNKYGLGNFKVEVLKTFENYNRLSLLNEEQQFLDLLWCNNIINIMRKANGGIINVNAGKKLEEVIGVERAIEVKNKMSEIRKEKFKNGTLVVKHSEETKRKIGLKSKLKTFKHSQAAKEKISKASKERGYVGKIKGKTLIEVYGEVRAEEIKQNMRKPKIKKQKIKWTF